MKKILCPTDFSETSINAITYASKLAKATNCQLTLLHAQSLFDHTPLDMTSGKELPLKMTSERLETLCQQVSKMFNISCYAEVEATYRQLSHVIKDKASAFDLIVMGSNGADDLYKFFTGTNTYKTIVNTETPVLLIPAGQLYGGIKKIVYAFDYLRERKLPLKRLISFIDALQCELVVLQVMEEAYSQEAEEDLRELQFIIDRTKREKVSLRYETIRSSEVAQSINSYVKRTQPDALALCSVHRNFLEGLFHKSIIKNISAVTDYPVFVFHDK